jgi:Putative prokaryotic signal transducing protein
MQVTLDDFRKHFELLSDAALLDTNRDELVATARQCYDEEVARRGLNSRPDEPVEGEVLPTEEPEGGRMVLVATYILPEEASLARGLLASAEIPFLMENELAPLGGFQIQLMVPADFEEDARAVLESEISEEELAAQAEAAGVLELEGPEAPEEPA